MTKRFRTYLSIQRLKKKGIGFHCHRDRRKYVPKPRVSKIDPNDIMYNAAFLFPKGATPKLS
jgi:hypothetical protein